MTPSEKREYWSEVIRLHRESGQAIKSFCDQEGLATHQFHYWRKRLLESSASSSPVFVPLQLTDPASSAREAISLHTGGYRIDLVSGFCPQALKDVLHVLSELSC